MPRQHGPALEQRTNVTPAERHVDHRSAKVDRAGGARSFVITARLEVAVAELCSGWATPADKLSEGRDRAGRVPASVNRSDLGPDVDGVRDRK
jgi:hypothetical protein